MKVIQGLLCKIKTGDESSDVYQELGKAYVDIKEIDKAYNAFLKALEFDDRDPWTHLYIGNIFFRKEDYRGAIKWFEKSINLIEDAAVPYWCLAECYEKIKEYSTADFYYRKAVHAEPESEEAQKRLMAWRRRKPT